MIASVSGTVIGRRAGELVVEAAGVGYRLLVSAETHRGAPGVGEQALLHTHLVIRDDAMQLYGFVEVPFDDSGRFVIPDHLETLASFGDQLYFQGAGAFFMIRSPDALAAMGTGWEGAQAACASLAVEAASKARKA